MQKLRELLRSSSFFDDPFDTAVRLFCPVAIWLIALSVPEGDLQPLAIAIAFVAFRLEWHFWPERPREPADDETD